MFSGNGLTSQLLFNAGRVFKKIELSESIRYASADPIESWLNALLCLDVTNSVPSISRFDLLYFSCLGVSTAFILLISGVISFFYHLVIRLPPPSECDLYYVNRDTLFSYHKVSEPFLQVIISNLKLICT